MKYWFYYLVKMTTWTFLRLKYGLEVYGIHNIPKEGSFVVASNHASHLDPVVVGVSCPQPVTFMARDTLFKNPIMSAFLKGVRTMPLKRDAGDIAAMRYAIELLKEGDVVGLFPEGTRSLDGSLGSAKRGIDLLAKKAKVAVVPVYLEGTFQALPKGGKKLQPSKIRVAFGPQIPYTSVSSGPKTSNPTEQKAQHKQAESLAVVVTARWQALKQALDNNELTSI